jgi:hypothetical protein
MTETQDKYSSISESSRIFHVLLDTLSDGISIPDAALGKKENVKFTGERDRPYFPIPFKETETTAALKAVESIIAASLADSKYGENSTRSIVVDQEKTTAFLFQAYLARIGGLGKLDKDVRKLLKGIVLLLCSEPSYWLLYVG